MLILSLALLASVLIGTAVVVNRPPAFVGELPIDLGDGMTKLGPGLPPNVDGEHSGRTSDGLRVDIERKSPDAGADRVVINLPEGAPSLRIEARRRGGHSGNAGIRTGDAALDGRVFIEGDPKVLPELRILEILPLLGAPVRERLTRLVVGQGAVVEHGRVSVTWDAPLTDSRVLEETARDLAALARELDATGAQPVERVTEMALSDPCPGVRVRAARMVLEAFSSSAEAERVASEVLDGHDALNRILAAQHLGGPEAFRAAAEVLVGPSPGAQQGLRLRALRLVGTSDDTRRDAVLAGMVPTASSHLLQALLQTVKERRIRLAAGPIAKRLADGEFDDFASNAALGTLCALGDPAAEEALLTVLESSEPRRLATIRALETVGTLRAVEPLLEWTSGVFRDREIKDAARTAIETIQARAGGAAGALAVVDDEGGALSIATTNEGAVTLTEE